jgi:hypothetical protein
MSAADAASYTSILDPKNPESRVTIMGGEPLLDVERTLAIGQAVLSRGLVNVEVITNGSWAADEETALDILQRLTRAGLTVPAVSVDAFHQRYVPREHPLHAMRAARRLGLSIGGSSELQDAQDGANVYDSETREIAEWFARRGFRVTPGLPANVVFQGRAVNLARLSCKPRHLPRDRCCGVPWFATSDFRHPGGLQIDVHGHAMVEHGVCIGNAKQKLMDAMLDEYDAETHPILRVLMKDGPMGLTRLPEADGFTLREEGYIDKCHLCQEVRTHLRPHFPEILCPENYYPRIF